VGADVKCLLLLAVVALFFVTELIPLAVTAMGGAIACGLLGFIPIKTVFRACPTPRCSFCRYVHSRCRHVHTGLAQKIGSTVVKLSGTGENSLMSVLCL
jgi:hypothetical protein